MKSISKINILVVDDHPENLLAMEAILDSPSYNVVRANSGEEALRRLLSHSFALVLMDVQMPGLSGLETAKMIRAQQKYRHIPIIFMSALHRVHEEVSHAYSAGGVDYLFSPYDPDVVRAKVAAFVDFLKRGKQLREQADILHQNERRMRYRNLAEAMPHPVWTARPDGHIDHINRYWRIYTGMTFEQSEGWGWTAALHPDDLRKCLLNLEQAIRFGSRCEIQCRIKRKDGTYRRHSIQTVPERDLKGELKGWFGTAIDIHDQKRHEEAQEEGMKVLS